MHKLYLNGGQINCWLRGELINIKYQLNIDLLLISWFLSWPQHTRALGSDSLYLQQKHSMQENTPERTD